MSKLIKNSLSGKLIIFNNERNKRKNDFLKNDEDKFLKDYEPNCPLCLGNEYMTPKETFFINDDNDWVVRSIPNKYPILTYEEDKYYGSEHIYGNHEVIIESNKHSKSFYNSNDKEFYLVLSMYLDRYKALNKKNIKYISIFKNYLQKAGASLEHSHSQIISMSVIPPIILKEIKNSNDFYKENNICFFDHKEKYNNIVLDNENFYAYVPGDSPYSLEVDIVSKNKCKFEDITKHEMQSLSEMMMKLFSKLYDLEGQSPFNMYLHTFPVNNKNLSRHYKYHFHIIQRNWFFGGFELSTGIHVNSMNLHEFIKKIKS